MFGRLLCTVGLHRLEWRSKLTHDAHDNSVVLDQYRCRRSECDLHKHWISANKERVRQPW